MFPNKTGIRTRSPEEGRVVLAFYEEEGYTHESMETYEDFVEYPILIIDDEFNDVMDITGCKEVYYHITDGTINVIDFDVWFAENIGKEFEAASEADMVDFLAS